MPRKRPNEAERIARAQAALELLQNPAFKEAMEEIEAKLMERATAPPVSVSKDDREWAYVMLQATRHFEKTLAGFLKTGEIDVMNRDARQQAANGDATGAADT